MQITEEVIVRTQNFRSIGVRIDAVGVRIEELMQSARKRMMDIFSHVGAVCDRPTRRFCPKGETKVVFYIYTRIESPLL